MAKTKKGKSLTKIEKEILGKVSTLIMSGLGFVTALAWNDAIQNLFREIFGQQKEIWAKFIYAVFLTFIVVIIGIQIDRILKKIGELKIKQRK